MLTLMIGLAATAIAATFGLALLRRKPAANSVRARIARPLGGRPRH